MSKKSHNTITMTQKWASAIGLLSLAAATIFLFVQASTSDASVPETEHKGDTPTKDYRVYALPINETLYFAGEQVPINDPFIRERFDRELLANTYFQSQGLLYAKRANRYFPVIEPILQEHGIPDDFKYLALIESGLMNVVSPAGAAGVWQFMKTTGPQYGLEVSPYVDERYHLEKATHAACKYLNEAYQNFGSWALAAAAYNAGSGRIKKSLRDQNVTNYFDLYLNAETSRYVFRIIAVREILENPRQYGFHFKDEDLYTPLPTYTVAVTQSISSLVDFAQENSITYKLLKHYNPWLRNTSLPVTAGKVYTITLPKKGVHQIMTELPENDSEESNVSPLVNDSIYE